MRLNSPITASLLVLLALAPARASQTQPVTMNPGAPVEVTVESFLDSKPTSGFMPMRVTLRNDSDATRSYTLSYAPAYRGDRYDLVSGEFTVSVGPGGRASSVVYVPVVPSQYAGSTEFRLSGPGVRASQFQLHSASGGYRPSSGFGYIGMGETFAARHVGAVDAEMKGAGGYHGNLPVTKIGPSFAPADRRAYDAFSTLWFYDTEWAALEPAAQTAIREWVTLGGRLHLVSPSGEDSVTPLGFGEISRVARGGEDKVFIKRMVERLRAVKPAATEMSDGQPNLFRAFASALETRPVALILLLLAFGLIIGPLNLFVFAKPPRRHRLLWTTPLIAVVAAALMMTFILFADGTGGSGRRFALGLLEPGQKRLALYQQQISRSGLLLGGSFAFEPNAQLLPIHEGTSDRSGEYEKTATGWSGDWFTSRAVQAHAVLDTVATRGDVRVVFPSGGKPGSVVSSLDTPLKSLLVISPDGASAYAASDLMPGVSRPLTPVDRAVAMTEWTESLKDSGDSLRATAGRLVGRKGCFYAHAAKPEALLRPTLDSIRWSDDVLLLTGPVETQN